MVMTGRTLITIELDNESAPGLLAHVLLLADKLKTFSEYPIILRIEIDTVI